MSGLSRWVSTAIVVAAGTSATVGALWLLPCEGCSGPSAQIHGAGKVIDNLMIMFLAVLVKRTGAA